VFFETVDDALGPAAGRFFGDGHRQVEHAVHGIVVDGADGSGVDRIAASASVSYPASWSAKGAASSELIPHLSTIDAVVMAACLGERYLAQVRGMEERLRRRAWLRSVQIRAGSAPQEDLADFSIEAKVVDSKPSPVSLCGHLTTFDCRIGQIKARCEIEHESDTPHRANRTLGTAEEPLCEDGSLYYTGGYRHTRRDIEDLCIEPAAGTAAALVAIMEPDGPQTGLEAEYRPSLSGIDGIVIAAQLAQVLLYQIDGVDRGATGTLWMRRASWAYQTPYQPVANPFVATVSTVKNRLIDKGGARWRTAEFQAQLLGLRGSFSVTHALPSAS
jgi:hypothetical protein